MAVRILTFNELLRSPCFPRYVKAFDAGPSCRSFVRHYAYQHLGDRIRHGRTNHSPDRLRIKGNHGFALMIKYSVNELRFHQYSPVRHSGHRRMDLHGRCANGMSHWQSRDRQTIPPLWMMQYAPAFATYAKISFLPEAKSLAIIVQPLRTQHYA